VGDLLAAVGLVWLLNLYNFMDSIDGIAGVEALSICLGATLLSLLSTDARAEWYLPALLAAATLGFLVWNFPPAKIFMGDAGSGFLGLMLGVLAVRAAAVSPAWLWSWIILLGVFVVDATMTLLRRWQRHETLYQAHRSHAYQHAAVEHGAHRPVTIAVATINLLWLLPIALLVGNQILDGALGVLISYAPLVWLADRYRAGEASS
jgi:Fuc2NAc and GlcNAc transferase